MRQGRIYKAGEPVEQRMKMPDGREVIATLTVGKTVGMIEPPPPRQAQTRKWGKLGVEIGLWFGLRVKYERGWETLKRMLLNGRRRAGALLVG